MINISKNIRFIAIIYMISISMSSIAQDSVVTLQSLGVSPTDIYYSDEYFEAYPRGFLYDLSRSDSMDYFSCFSTDSMSVTDYVLNNKPAFRLPYGNKVERYGDIIELRKFDKQIENFRDFKGNKLKAKDFKQYDRIIIYYWKSDMHNPFYASNFEVFQTLVKENPEKKIKLMIVDVSKVHYDGVFVNFEKDSHDDVLAKAKQDNKPLMLFFHFDGCGGCLAMFKTTLRSNKVVNYFDKNYLCQDINVKKPDGIPLEEKYETNMYPTFLFLNNSGEVVHKIVGIFDEDQFIAEAEKARSQNNLSTMKTKYASGDRSGEFLLEYAYALSNASELDSSIINQYLRTQSEADLKLEKNIRFLYQFATETFAPNVPFNSREYQFMMNNKKLFNKHFDSDQIDARIVWIAQSKVYGAIEKKDKTGFEEGIKVLEQFNGRQHYLKNMTGGIVGMTTTPDMVTGARLEYYSSLEMEKEYNETLDIYVKSIWDDANQLNSFAWTCYENETERNRLEVAESCAKRAVELNANYPNLDTYAALLFKLGHKEKGIEQAKLAIKTGKSNHEDVSSTEQLLKENL